MLVLTYSGMTPAAAELCYLKNAVTLDMYGVDMHAVLVSLLFSVELSL